MLVGFAFIARKVYMTRHFGIEWYRIYCLWRISSRCESQVEMAKSMYGRERGRGDEVRLLANLKGLGLWIHMCHGSVGGLVGW